MKGKINRFIKNTPITLFFIIYAILGLPLLWKSFLGMISMVFDIIDIVLNVFILLLPLAGLICILISREWFGEEPKLNATQKRDFKMGGIALIIAGFFSLLLFFMVD